MATPIPGAYPSPRIDKGVLRWYEGDTFSIVLRFDLKDQDGEAVTIGTTDSMAVVFLIRGRPSTRSALRRWRMTRSR